MALAPPRRPTAALARSWRRPAAFSGVRDPGGLDRVELALLACFAAVSMWILALDVFQVAFLGRVWTGTDGLYVPDQMQYLAWIRDASHHVLASNLYVVHGTPHDYLQPAVAISGGLTALGVAPWLSLLLWKPIAVFTALFAFTAYIRRMVPRGPARQATLALGLFFGSVGVLADGWLPFWSWGYPFGLLAMAGMVGALLSYDRARSEGRISWLAPVLAMLASWLHPWEGELLILIITGAEALDWRAIWERPSGRARLRRLAAPAITIVAAALPLAYYALLDHFDVNWRLARSGIEPHHIFLDILLALGPLLVCAIPAYRRRPENFLAAATRMWPVAAAIVYVMSSAVFGEAPLHAIDGVTIPLAILTVQSARLVGFERLRHARPLGIALVLLATVPASGYMLGLAFTAATDSHNRMNFVGHDVEHALSYLRHNPRPGAVLTDFAYGTVVPAATGRHTFIGDCQWTPNCILRSQLAYLLLYWPEDGADARTFVRNTDARFVLAGCHGHAGGLRRKLRPLTRSVHDFGCVTLYELS